MAIEFNAFATPASTSATKITFTGSVVGTTVELNGTGMSWNDGTDTLTATTLTSVVLKTGVDTTQTVTLDPANAGTIVASLNSFLSSGNSIIANITTEIGAPSAYAAPTVWGTDLNTGLDYADIVTTAGGSDYTLRVIGNNIGEFDQPAGATVSYIEIYDDTDTLIATLDYSLSPRRYDVALYAFGINDDALGNYLLSGDDTIVGTGVVDGGLGDDDITGSGTDTLSYDSATSKVTASLATGTSSLGGGNDTFSGFINLTGSKYAGDRLTGDSGDNILDGGLDSGKDFLDGGLGNDTYVLRDGTPNGAVSGTVDNIADAGGIDTITTTISRDLNDFLADIENLTLLGTATEGYGNEFDNVITGNDENNILDGRQGTDTMIGGLGDDIFYVDSASDTVVEDVGEGNDTIRSLGSYTLAAGVEVETLETTLASGVGAVNLTGNEFANIINGNTGQNVLDGGSDGLGNDDGEIDTLTGGDGNDTYVIYDGDDTVVELNTGAVSGSKGGNDTIKSTISRDLADFANVENIILTGSNNAFALGSDVTNVLVGNDGDNYLNGLGGTDYLVGDLGADTIEWDGAGRDVSIDFSQADGDQIALDTMNIGDYETIQALAYAVGTTGTLLRTVTNNSVHTLKINTLAKADMLETDFSFASGTGDQVFVGNAGSDYMFGADGNDILQGGAGIDYLFGETGNDNINGGTGGDRMYGGLGDDNFIVDSLSDYIVDNAGEGTDTVFTTISFVLPAVSGTREIENLFAFNQSSTNKMNLVGNDLNNSITGNDGDNVINGGAGADIMTGNGGNDVYYVDNSLDQVNGEGALDGDADRVFTTVNFALGVGDHVEFVNVLGSGNVNISGNELDQTLVGGAGLNVIDGKEGNDTLWGLGGNDFFAFTTALNASTNVDTIMDFNAAFDTIRIDDAIFTALSSGPGVLNAAEFYMGTAAHDADDRIVYDRVSGNVMYDADGNGAGAAVTFAVVANKTTLTNADFHVI